RPATVPRPAPHPGRDAPTGAWPNQHAPPPPGTDRSAAVVMWLGVYTLYRVAPGKVSARRGRQDGREDDPRCKSLSSMDLALLSASGTASGMRYATFTPLAPLG